jgi:hypothetical protein
MTRTDPRQLDLPSAEIIDAAHPDILSAYHKWSDCPLAYGLVAALVAAIEWGPGAGAASAQPQPARRRPW